VSGAPLRHAIFLSGPIGVGKTTLGRAVSARLNAAFIDGDDHADHDKPWYGSSLATSRSIIATGLRLLEAQPVLVVAYPLRCTNWLYFRRRFGEAGVRPLFVSLRAGLEAILDPARGRAFDVAERQRIAVMLAEGYAERPFSDLVFDTDRAGFEATVGALERALRTLLASEGPAAGRRR
jgi:hypothetical protein